MSYQRTGIKVSQKDDRAAYIKEYRKRRPEYVAEQKRVNAIRDRALRRLAREYPARLRQLIVEERARDLT